MRKGMTRRYRTQKLAQIESELEEGKREQKLESLAFGEHDPFEVPMNSCENCGGTARVEQRTARKGLRFIARCQQCDVVPSEEWAKRPWLAALDWNGKNLGTAPHYAELPLFGLAGRSAEDAKAHLVAIRENLEKRRKAAGLRRSLRQEKQGPRPPGKQYQQKLDSYLKWSMYALRVMKVQAGDIKRPA
jgi:hypothetical protein